MNSHENLCLHYASLGGQPYICNRSKGHPGIHWYCRLDELARIESLACGVPREELAGGSPAATETQVGGSHYKDFKIQPIEFITANGLPFIEGCIIKYACRHGRKNGREDVEKIIHYAQLLLQLKYPREGDK